MQHPHAIGADGTIRISLGVEESGATGLDLYTDEGDLRVSLGIDDEGRTGLDLL